MRVLIVSRHKSTQNLLKKLFSKYTNDIKIVDHLLSPSDIDSDVIAGNIPISMFINSRARFYVSVSLELPRELRGKELDESELEKYLSFAVYEKIYTRREINSIISNMILYLSHDPKIIEKALFNP